MKKTNKSMYLIFTLLMFGICISNVKAADYTNYFGIEMTNKQYNNLLNQGFDDYEIYLMDAETFNTNKDIEAELVSINSKYYKSIYTGLDGSTQVVEMTKEEYENESSNQMRGYVQTQYKRMDAYISQVDSAHFRYKVTVGWLQMPAVRSYDIIGLAFEYTNVSMVGILNFRYNYCVQSGTCYTDGTFYYQTETFNGGSTVYKIPSSPVSLSATLYYDVEKKTTDTITAQLIHGDYAHATTNVNSSIYTNHGMTRGGLSLGTSVPYYDDIPCATTGWTGSW